MTDSGFGESYPSVFREGGMRIALGGISVPASVELEVGQVIRVRLGDAVVQLKVTSVSPFVAVPLLDDNE